MNRRQLGERAQAQARNYLNRMAKNVHLGSLARQAVEQAQLHEQELVERKLAIRPAIVQKIREDAYTVAPYLIPGTPSYHSHLSKVVRVRDWQKFFMRTYDDSQWVEGDFWHLNVSRVGATYNHQQQTGYIGEATSYSYMSFDQDISAIVIDRRGDLLTITTSLQSDDDPKGSSPSSGRRRAASTTPYEIASSMYLRIQPSTDEDLVPLGGIPVDTNGPDADAVVAKWQQMFLDLMPVNR